MSKTKAKTKVSVSSPTLEKDDETPVVMPPDQEIRRSFFDKCRACTGFDDAMVIDIEKGLFNWSLNQADTFKIQKTWTNQKFEKIYLAKMASLLFNLDSSSYVENKTLIDRVRDGRLQPHELAFLRPSEMFPERWQDVVNLKVQREEYAINVKPVAMTDQFRCDRCKKRECVYQEIQLRSADEPATIIITCNSCSHTWRVG